MAVRRHGRDHHAVARARRRARPEGQPRPRRPTCRGPEWYFFFLFELLRVIKPPSLVPLATIGVPTLGDDPAVPAALLRPRARAPPRAPPDRHRHRHLRHRRDGASSPTRAPTPARPRVIEMATPAAVVAGRRHNARASTKPASSSSRSPAVWPATRSATTATTGPGRSSRTSARACRARGSRARSSTPPRRCPPSRTFRRRSSRLRSSIPFAAEVVASLVMPAQRHGAGTLEAGEVQTMFDRIAGVYDPLNTAMTAGPAPSLARARRRPGARAARARVLDVAAGTGDLALALRARGAPGRSGGQRLLRGDARPCPCQGAARRQGAAGGGWVAVLPALRVGRCARAALRRRLLRRRHRRLRSAQLLRSPTRSGRAGARRATRRPRRGPRDHHAHARRRFRSSIASGSIASFPLARAPGGRYGDGIHLSAQLRQALAGPRSASRRAGARRA